MGVLIIIIGAIMAILPPTGIVAATALPTATTLVTSGLNATAPGSASPTVLARNEPSLPNWRPAENAMIQRYDPRYHPGNIKQPPPSPPEYSPTPIKRHGKTNRHFERYVSWVARDHMATSICEYNGHVVPCYPEGLGFQPWYRDLSSNYAEDFGTESAQWRHLPDTDVYGQDAIFMPNYVHDYKQKADRDEDAVCKASYNGWEVPSRCGQPSGDYKRSRFSRFTVFPPKSEEPPKPHHFWGDSDSRETSPYYPSAEQYMQSYQPGNTTCYQPKRGSRGLRQNAPEDGVRRNIFEACDAMAAGSGAGTYIALPARNIDNQLMENANWYTSSAYNPEHDVLVETSVRFTADPLQLHRGHGPLSMTVKDCRERLYATVDQCSGPDEYGSGVSVVNDNIPVLVEVGSQIVAKEHRLFVNYQKPNHPIKGEEAYFATAQLDHWTAVVSTVNVAVPTLIPVHHGEEHSHKQNNPNPTPTPKCGWRYHPEIGGWWDACSG